MPQPEPVSVETYLYARSLIEKCGCGVTVSDSSTFKVIPDGGDEKDRIFSTLTTSELAVFARGLSAGFDLGRQTETKS